MIKFSVLLLVSLVYLQGCVAVQTFPTVARSGDTVALAVGSPDGMTKVNTTAQFVHADGLIPPIDLPIRAIVRLRPDNTSNVALFDSNINSLTGNSRHSAWLSIVVVDLPLGIPPGNGVINITTSASYFGPGANDIPIAIEILEGTGSANPFNYDFLGNNKPGDLSSLEPKRQIVIKSPAHVVASEYYGAAEIKVYAPIRKVSDPSLLVGDGVIRVVMDDNTIHNVDSQTHMNWLREGDYFTVNFISPIGFRHHQVRFSIVLRANNKNQFITSPSPSVVSAIFYDENGNVVTNSATPIAMDYSIFTDYISAP